MAVLETTLQTSIAPYLGSGEEWLWEAWMTPSGVRVGLCRAVGGVGAGRSL